MLQEIKDSFCQMTEALRQGKIVALEKDETTGRIRFGGAFDNDTDAALAYSGDDRNVCSAKVIFIKDEHILSGVRYQM